ncbi:hypothetical protein Avbf_10530 [Armadillidium vulgare]|nr:hypothetical protein Avbf_10530 [Armadillidium vulgare]
MSIFLKLKLKLKSKLQLAKNNILYSINSRSRCVLRKSMKDRKKTEQSLARKTISEIKSLSLISVLRKLNLSNNIFLRTTSLLSPLAFDIDEFA